MDSPSNRFAVTLSEPAPTEHEGQVTDIVMEASALVVSDAASHLAGQELRQRVVRFIKAFEAELDPFVKDAHDAWKRACARRDERLQAARQVLTLIDPKILDYEKKAKAEAEAERMRKQAAAVEEAKRLRAAEAKAATAQGDKELAKIIRAEPIAVPRVAVAPALGNLKGSSSRTTWSAEVVDFRKLIAWVAANPGNEDLLEANQSALNARARGQKDMLAIPGVRPVSTTGLTTRT